MSAQYSFYQSVPLNMLPIQQIRSVSAPTPMQTYPSLNEEYVPRDVDGSFWEMPHSISPTPRELRTRLVIDDEDDDLNIDTSNLTPEEKQELKNHRKLRKTNREKVKRSKLNDQFDHLCKMLAMDKATRVEKLSVLNATIKVLNQLRFENVTLKEQKRQMKEIAVLQANGVHPLESLSQMSPRQLQISLPLIAGLEIQVPSPTEYPGQSPAAPGTASSEILTDKDGFGKAGVWNESSFKQEAPTPVPVAAEPLWGMFQPPPRANDLDFAFGNTTPGGNPSMLPGIFGKVENFSFGTDFDVDKDAYTLTPFKPQVNDSDVFSAFSDDNVDMFLA